MADNEEFIYVQISQNSLFPDLEEKEVCKDETELFLGKFHQDVRFLDDIRKEFLKYKESLSSLFLKHVTRNYLRFVKEYFIDTNLIYDNKELLQKEEDYRLLGELFYFYLLYFKEKEHESPFFKIMEDFINIQGTSLKSELKSKEVKQKEKQQQSVFLEDTYSREIFFFGIPFYKYTQTQMELFFHMVFIFSEDSSLFFKDGYGKNSDAIFKICEMILIYLSRYVYFIFNNHSREDYKVNDFDIVALENFVYKYTDYFRLQDSTLCLARSILMKRVAVRRNIDPVRREYVVKNF